MKHLFVDTNVVIDLILDRKPFNEDAVSLFTASEAGRVTLYISSLSIKDVYYISNKIHSHEKILEIINWIDSLTHILPVTAENVRAATRSASTDFEDAMQHECACSEKRIEAIVTRDGKDFKHSRLPVFTPTEALLQI